MIGPTQHSLAMQGTQAHRSFPASTCSSAVASCLSSHRQLQHSPNKTPQFSHSAHTPARSPRISRGLSLSGILRAAATEAPRTPASTAAAATSAYADASTAADPRLVKQGTPLKSANLAAHYDAVVIGSGIGGLAAAVALAKFAGKRVCVLEQHYTAGGFTHAFSRGPYAWNVGVHYIGGGIGSPGGGMFPVFNALTGGRVSWAQLPAVYDRIILGGRTYDFVTGREAWLQKMTSHFPKERQALEQVIELSDKAYSAFNSLMTTKALPAWLSGLAAPWTTRAWQDLAGQTSGQLMATLTQDPELASVLAGQWVDIGLPPGSSSAAYQLVLFNHYLEGGYVPVGGASSIAAAMIPIIEAAGGAVVTSADVSQVLVTGGKASGVRLATGEEVTCDMVISNAGLLNTYTHLLPPEVLASQPQLQQQLAAAAAAGSSISAAVLYIGLKGSRVPEFQGLGNIHKHHSRDMDGDVARYLADPAAPLPAVFMSCCDGREEVSYVGAAAAAGSGSSSSSSSSSTGCSTMQVATVAPFDWYERWSGSGLLHKRSADYQEGKQQMTERLIAELGAVFPDLPGRIAYSELSTPLSTQHFSRWGRGAMYGINASPEKFRACGGLGFGPRTPVAGLYLTGQDVAGDGVVAAMMAGVVAGIAAAGPGVKLQMDKEEKKWM